MPVLKKARWEKFCQEYVKGASAVDAYERAGYKRQKSEASVLHSRPEIQERISELQGRAAERAEISTAKVLEELAKIGFSNMQDYMRSGPDGDPYLDFSQLTREQAAALVEVTVEDFKEGRGKEARDVRRVKFKLADKRAALVDIGKHLGMFIEKHEHTGKDGKAIKFIVEG